MIWSVSCAIEARLSRFILPSRRDAEVPHPLRPATLGLHTLSDLRRSVFTPSQTCDTRSSHPLRPATLGLHTLSDLRHSVFALRGAEVLRRLRSATFGLRPTQTCCRGFLPHDGIRNHVGPAGGM